MKNDTAFHNKVKTPFCELFKAVSPKNFVCLFKGEYPQTAAFILSFCPKKNYIKKVINFFDKEEKHETKDEDSFSFVFRKYLNHNGQKKMDKHFIEKLEVQVSIMLEEFMDLA